MAISLSLAAFALAPASLTPLRVVGNKVVDGTGRAVVLRGVNVPSLEWSSTGERVLDRTRAALDEWNANLIRLPMSEDRWFGKMPEQSDGGRAYRRLVREVVDLARSRGARVILDLHWTTRGEWGKDVGQHDLPDVHALEFWDSVAKEYRNDPAAVFDLYNEPRMVTWEQWLDGGMIEDKEGNKTGPTFRAVGFRHMLAAVRRAGAKNLVVASGTGWSTGFAGALDGRGLKDPSGNGVVYANHVYPFGGETIPQWEQRMVETAKKIPLWILEFGSDPEGGKGQTGEQWVTDMVATLQRRGWTWTAWCFHPKATPSLITTDGSPTPWFGRVVKAALLSSNPKR